MTTPNPNESRQTFTPHLVIGFGLIFLGVVLMLDRMGLVPVARSLQYWPIGLVLLGAAMVAQAMRGGGPASVSNGHHGQFPVGPAILLLIFILVFVRPFQPSAAAGDASGRQQLVAVMGGDTRRSAGEPFHGAHMTAVMGGAELDLRKATVTDNEPMVVEVFALMGGTVLRVPPEWTVEVKVRPVMGGVSDERRGRAEDSFDDAPGQPQTRPHLIVRGSVVMGGVVIKS